MKRPVMGRWYKASYSDAGKQCVEVRHDAAATLVRDTKDEGRGPILEFPAEVWSEFIESGIWQR